MKIKIILIMTFIIKISLLSPTTLEYSDQISNKSTPILQTFLLGINNLKNKIFNFFQTDFYFENPENYKNISLESIIGFSNQKKELSLYMNTIPKFNRRKKDLIFIGPPGMQKIKFAYALANKIKHPLLIIEPFNFIHQVDFKQYIDTVFSFLKQNSSAIVYITNSKLIPFYSKERDEQKEMIYYLKKNIKQINTSQIIFIFDISDIFQLDLLDEHKSEYKTIMFNFIEEDDCIRLIQFYLNEYNLTLENEKLIDNLYSICSNMTVDDIENTIDSLYIMVSDKEEQQINESIINELFKKLKKNNEMRKNETNTTEIVRDKTLDDIWGYESIKNKLFAMIPSIQNKNEKQKGILFTGPPGVGKTQMIRALAGSAGIRFITINPARLLSENGENIHWNIYNIFERAKLAAPSILFIDEIDVLLNNEIAKSSLLIELDGQEKLLGVTVIGATNYGNQIDYRIKRSGRMSIEINLPLPNTYDRSEIIKNYLKKINIKNVEENILNQLIERTINFSGADIEEYIYNIKSYLEKNNLEQITSDTIFNVYIEMILGSKKTMLINEKELIQVAYHEACHGLLQYILYRQKLSPMNFSFLTIEPHENALGASCAIGDDYYKSYTKTYLESEIKILLAGRCAQEIFLNTIDTGAVSDLQKATTIAHQYIDKFGMGKRLSVKKDFIEYEFEQSKKILDEVELLLQKEYNLVKKFLSFYKELVNIIVKKLLEKKLLHKQEFDIIIHNYEKCNNLIIMAQQ